MSRSTSGSTTGSADGSTRSAGAVVGLLSSLVRHAPRDLSLTSVSTLSTLDRTGPRRVTDLAMAQGVTQPSVTSLVTTLERAGLVERRNDPADRRVVLVAITTAGSEYLHARRRANIEAFAHLIDRLPPDEAAALAAAIPALEHLRELDDEQRDPSPSTDGAHASEHV
ncbi:MarR family winged helix-turn-helix transcriptional regulator [Streptomyces sp. NPDC059373]